MSNPASSVVTGRARSCTGCRQVKLACDARRTAPNPCTRCKHKGLQCKFDSNFKRIPMRRVAQEITNGIHNLLPTPAATAAATSPAQGYSTAEISSGVDRSSTPSVDHVATFAPPESTQSQGSRKTGPWLTIADNDYYVKYVLGNVELDADTTIGLARHFNRYYLIHAPFLENVDSLYALSIRSPLLFWTIILTSTREHDKHDGLYEQICVAHAVLLSQIAQVAVHTVQDIHALLLLCLWPIPKTRQQHDPAWNYIGIATNAAMQLNCHRPLPIDGITGAWKGMMDQTAADIGPETAALTWIHCFQIGARIAAFQGLPPPLATTSQLRSITKAVTAITSVLTEEQKAAAEILRLSCLSTSEVDCTEDLQARYSLIHMFDAQFNSIHQSYHSHWTTELDVEFLASKIYLYALLLVVANDNPQEQQQNMLNRQVILLRARDASLKLISRMAQLSNTPIADGFYPAGALSFYPKEYFTSLFMAACFLFRFLASYHGITQHDTATVVYGLTEAHKILQSFPEHRDAVKAAIVIQLLVDIIRYSDGSQPPFPLSELIVNNRLGASVIFDASFRAGHLRNRNPITGASLPITDWLMSHDDPRQRVPLTPEQKAANSVGNSSNHGTDNGSSNSQHLISGPWSGWDNYMNDFEVGSDQWSNEMLAQMDPATQVQMFEATAVSPLPMIGSLTQY